MQGQQMIGKQSSFNIPGASSYDHNYFSTASSSSTTTDAAKKELQRKLSGKGKELLRQGTADSPKRQASSSSLSNDLKDLNMTSSSDITTTAIKGNLPWFISAEERLPPFFEIIDGYNLVGTVLMRVTSKKLFRKWKEVFFVLNDDSLGFYTSKASWNLSYAPLHKYQLRDDISISNVFLQTIGSVGEKDIGVYFVRLVEVHTTLFSESEFNARMRAESVNNSNPNHMSEDEFKTLLKFGAKDSRDIIFLGNAIKRILRGKDEVLGSRSKTDATRTSTDPNKLNVSGTSLNGSSSNPPPRPSVPSAGAAQGYNNYAQQQKTATASNNYSSSTGGVYDPFSQTSTLLKKSQKNDQSDDDDDDYNTKKTATKDPWQNAGWTPFS